MGVRQALDTFSFLHTAHLGQCDRCRDYGHVIWVTVFSPPAGWPFRVLDMKVMPSGREWLKKLELCDWCQLAQAQHERLQERSCDSPSPSSR